MHGHKFQLNFKSLWNPPCLLGGRGRWLNEEDDKERKQTHVDIRWWVVGKVEGDVLGKKCWKKKKMLLSPL